MKNTDNSINQIAKKYRILSFGDVAKGYSLEEEYKIYEEVATLVSRKYGKFISKEEIQEILASKGRIFSMRVKGRTAFYEYATANIGIPHFLRLTTTLCHELIHKIGYLRKDKTFIDMNPEFKEAGTEFVSATSMDDKFGRIVIFEGVYGKFPNKTDVKFLSIALVNQINQALGNQTLEKSILLGHDYFKEEIIKKWGEEYYIFFSENIKDIARIEKRYWKDYYNLEEKEKISYQEDLKKRITDFQDTIVDVEYRKRIKNIKSKKEAVKFLEEFKNFGFNRIRHLVMTNDKKSEYVDTNFSNVFQEFKEILEQSYGNLDITYDDTEWQKKYQKKELIDEVTEQEADEIYFMARDLRKKLKANNGISGLISKLFNYRNNFDEKKYLSKPIRNYEFKDNTVHIKYIPNEEIKVKRKQVESENNKSL